jgi:outer membrane receptor for monomeric catechols
VLGAELAASRYDRVDLPGFSDSAKPSKLDTDRVPLFFRYFLPGGFAVGATATYVIQEVDFPAAGGGVTALDSKFWVVDAELSYRLPRRAGVVSLVVKNLHDKDFNYQDMNFRSGTRRLVELQPVRRVFASATFSF